MYQALKAIYQNGAFILQTDFDLPEGTEVELLIQSPLDVKIKAAAVSNQVRRKRSMVLIPLTLLFSFRTILW